MAAAQKDKPNTLVIWGDDTGVRRASPIDSIANELLKRDAFRHDDVTTFAAQAIAGKFAATFKDLPPRQQAMSFTIDQAMVKTAEASSGAGH